MGKEVLLIIMEEGKNWSEGEWEAKLTIFGEPNGFESNIADIVSEGTPKTKDSHGNLFLGTSWPNVPFTESDYFRSRLASYLSDSNLRFLYVHPSFAQMKSGIQAYIEVDGKKYPKYVFNALGEKGSLAAATADGYRYYFGDGNEASWRMSPEGGCKGSAKQFVIGALMEDFAEGKIVYWGSEEFEAHIKDMASK